jgi:hypothetical protein
MSQGPTLLPFQSTYSLMGWLIILMAGALGIHLVNSDDYHQKYSDLDKTIVTISAIIGGLAYLVLFGNIIYVVAMRSRAKSGLPSKRPLPAQGGWTREARGVNLERF